MTEPATSVLPRWRTGTVASGGEDIYYEVVEVEDDGSRPTVVLTHGAGGTHAIWYQQVAAFASRYRVVTWDARGFGNSTYRTARHGATESAGDLEAVLDATATGDAHLVGQSMGGWWVTTFALAHPERTRSLVLTNTVGGLWTDELLAAYGEYVKTARADAVARAGQHPALGEERTSDDLAHAFLYQQLGTFHTPPFVDVAKALAGTRHAHADLRALAIPTLMVTGSADPIFAADHVRDVAQRVGAELVEIRGAGHSPYWEQPADYNAILLDFLGRTEQARS
jgi:pimeloyl-ACP methyl ester carboxylesterase